MKWCEHYWYKIPCMKSRIEEIVRRVNGSGLKVGTTVLDAGCNEGFLSQALIEAGCVVTSIDNNPQAIKSAWEMFGIKAIQADINYLPFDNDAFDVAVGGEVLEHLGNPGQGLRELFRVSRSRVIISLPLGAYWLGEPTHKWTIEAKTIEHDQGIITRHNKELLILEFIKK